MEHVEDEAGWPGRLTATVAKVVRERRAALKMSATDVSDACSELGYPIPRVVVTKLENGYRQHLTIAEMLVLARALHLAPLELIAPVGSPDPVEVLPGRSVRPWSAWLWASGKTFQWPVADETIDRDGRLEAGPLALWLEHAELVERWAVERSAVYSRRLGDSELEHELLTARLTPIERDVRLQREACRRLGVELPPLPDEVRAAITARGEDPDGERGEEA